MPVQGYLAMVLHAHLPLVRHPGSEPALEERWYLQAAAECYLPLLLALYRLVHKGADFALTISLSPTLLAMFRDPYLNARLSRYLQKLVELSSKEEERTAGGPFYGLARFYGERFTEIQKAYQVTFRGDLARAFAGLAACGKIELITTAATHGYLPLMRTGEGRRAQVQAGLEYFQESMGFKPRGFWLPECGYLPGLDKILGELGLDYFFVETHGILHATPPPPFGPYRPLACAESGLAALARDPESSRQVWSRDTGYPGDPAYREFYRDLGYDLPWEYLQPFFPEGVRSDTGFKYYRITGSEPKDLYDPVLASLRAEEHAGNFLFNRQHQIAHLADRMEHPPLVVAPYDAELFGHWWYEGPLWLERFLERVASSQGVFRLATPSAYLKDFPPTEAGRLHLSSWGEGGYSKVWLNPANDRLYPKLHQAEESMVELASLVTAPSPLERRFLNQMARELLLAQSSDWAFILHAGTANTYASRRATEHLESFFHLATLWNAPEPEVELLSKLEEQHALFPRLDYLVYRRKGRVEEAREDRPDILILTWEYPPRVVGGIAPHVHDLARALSELGVTPHVLTLAEGPQASMERDGPVRVYRVPAPPAGDMDFRQWVFAFNLRMLDFINECFPRLFSPWQVIHAHDWLVGQAAAAYAADRLLPLVATIHATEYGRNAGLHNAEQLAIHREEARLVGMAQAVICCSRSMQEEVEALFPASGGKVTVIPNGVDPAELEERAPYDLPWPAGHPLIFFMGRLVLEKGVQVLLEAAPRILAEAPEARFVLAGSGPYAGELQRLAAGLGLGEAVCFTGFLEGPTRNELCSRARVAVFPSLYEPFGIVALEAMALGTPVVVSATGGLAETVENEADGLVFPPGDRDALAACVLRLLQNPEYAATLARQAALKVSRHYAWPSLARRTLAVYRLAAFRRYGFQEFSTGTGTFSSRDE